MAMDAAAIDDTFFPKEPRGRDEGYLRPNMPTLVERKKKNRKLPTSSRRLLAANFLSD